MTIWPTKDRVYVDGIDCPCRIQYGVNNGGMENDYITVAREDNGKLAHRPHRPDQVGAESDVGY
jgi:hypothetical protein